MSVDFFPSQKRATKSLNWAIHIPRRALFFVVFREDRSFFSFFSFIESSLV